METKRFALPFLLGLLLLCAGAPQGNALTVVTRNFDELVTRADTVFKGMVSTRTSQWTGGGANRHIVTFVTFQIEETYKGVPASTQTLRFLGGTVGADTMEIAEMPRFEPGERAVLFVVGNGRQFCPLVGIGQGRFHVVRDGGAADGHERVFTDEGSPVVSTAEIGQFDEAGQPRLRRYVHTNTPAMTAEDFRAAILGKVAALPR